MPAPDTRITVVAVEDDPAIRDLVVAVLESEGIEVVGCATGAAALGSPDVPRASLILLDLTLPDLTPEALIEALRAREIQTPICLLTASTDAEERSVELGAAGYVGKPFDLDVLISTVRGLAR